MGFSCRSGDPCTHPDLIVDVAPNHEFGGNNMTDASRNGELRDVDPAKILEATARTKICLDGKSYAARSGVTYVNT